MPPLTEAKIILVKRRSRLDDLVTRFNSAAQAKFYIEHQGADFSDYQQEHEEYTAAIAQAAEALETVGRLQLLDRAFLPNFIFGPTDVVVAIGQDGLVANTLKYLNGQPLVGVNPAPQRWDGVLLPFRVIDLVKIVPEVIQGRRKQRQVTMGEALLNNSQVLFAVNDLFIGQRTHVSARYQLQFGQVSEVHSSSGIIVSTGFGSTGWLKSILAGASGIVGSLAGQIQPASLESGFGWDSDYLYFSVREPFPSRTTGAGLVFGKITPQTPLRITSNMAENGVIFSDGVESDFLEFNSGATATITVAEKKGILVI
jgi:NAD kinase